MTGNASRQRFKAALCQMESGSDPQANLAAAAAAIDVAAAAGALIACLPEMWPCMDADPQARLACAEAAGSGPAQRLLAAKAAEHRIHIIGGSIPLLSDQPRKAFNSCLLYDPAGELLARYDKMHLFRFEGDDRSYDESLTCAAGSQPAWADTDLGRIGLSICYDLRFPELYRAMDHPDLIAVPSAFTEQTGRAHWQALLQARAIENQCHVLAPAQCGTHGGGLRTWGHSMAVSPWGEVVAAAGSEPGVFLATVDHGQAAACRRRLPALDNRVL